RVRPSSTRTSPGGSALIPKTRRSTYWIYLIPGLALLTVVILIPLVWNIYLTFTDYRGIAPPEWTGLDKCIQLTHDEKFWKSFQNSLAMIAAMVVAPTIGDSSLLRCSSTSSVRSSGPEQRASCELRTSCLRSCRR